MAKKKQEHFIPKESYLSFFADKSFGKPSLWVYENPIDIIKNKFIFQKPKNITPHNLCKESYLYEGANLPNNALEDLLATIEHDYQIVLESKILDKKDLSQSEIEKISLFISSLEMRTPLNLNNTENFIDQLLEKVTKLEEAKMSGQKSELHLELEQVKKDKQMFIQSIVASLDFNRWILSDFCFLYLEDDFDDDYFLTSDFPVNHYDFTLMNSFYGIPPLSSTIEVTVPLTPKITLLINNAGFTGYHKIDFNMMTEINNRTIIRGNKYLLSSRKIDEKYIPRIASRARQSLLLYLMRDDLEAKDNKRKKEKIKKRL